MRMNRLGLVIGFSLALAGSAAAETDDTAPEGSPVPPAPLEGPPPPLPDGPPPPPPLPEGPPPPILESPVLRPAVEPPAPEARMLAVPAPDPTVHRHDGLYLRIGVGFGLFGSRVDSPLGELGARDGGPASELSIGGTIAEGLVLGGGLYLARFSSVTWSGDALRDFEGSRDREVEGGRASLAVLGIMVDYYPDARAGFHVQGALGLAGLGFGRHLPSGLPEESWSGGGGGLMLGVGYEVWVAEQWSLGALARLLLVSGTLRVDGSEREIAARAFAPALLIGATHH